MATKSGTIELEVEEGLGIEREGYPVTAGMPFPAGALYDVGELSLKSDREAPLPLQARPLNTRKWEDGSLRWVLLDFQLDLAAGEKKKVYLHYGKEAPAKPARPLMVSENATSIIVDTGPLKFRVSKQHFNLFDQVWLNGEEMVDESGERGAFAIDGKGQEYSSGADGDVRVEIEEQGELRTVIKASGTHTSEAGEKFLDFVVRIHAYAEQPFVRVLYSFYNMGHGESEVKRVVSGLWFRDQDVYFHRVREIRLQMPLKLDGERTVLLAGYPLYVYELSGNGSLYQSHADAEWQGEHIISHRGETPPQMGCRLIQHLENPKAKDPHSAVPPPWTSLAWERQAEEGVNELVRLGTGDGWMDCSDRNRGVSVSARYFWQNAPKKMAADEKGIAIFLWPVEAGELELTEGAGKTHEIFFHFHPGDGWQARVNRAVERFREPLVATVSPQWYQDCGVFGNIFPRVPGRWMDFEAEVEAAYVRWGGRQAVLKGMMNFGETEIFDRGGIANYMANHEYDLPHGILLQFARTGDRNYFLDAEPMVQHMMDVDYIRYSRKEQDREGLHIHCVDHTTAPPVPSHQWVDGLLDFYHLTGDEEALEVARGVGRNCIKQVDSPLLFATAREAGWNLVALTSIYEATREENYGEALKRFLNILADWQNPEDGGFYSELADARYRPSGGAFTNATICTGLYQYWKSTGDELVKEVFRKAVAWIANQRTAVGLFRAWNLDIWHLFVTVEPFAHAVEMLDTDQYMKIAMEVWEHHIRSGYLVPTGQGIIMGMWMRSIFRVVHVADELGLLTEAFGE